MIAAEYCEASFEATFYIPLGDMMGDASNDLGFELDEDVESIYIYEEGQPILIGYTVTGVAKGTRYTAVDGAEEITLTLNPFASVLVADGFCEAKVLYEARIIVPRVQLTGTTRFDTVDPPQIKFLTGQQIKAEVTFATPPGYIPEHLANPGIASRIWSVTNPSGKSWAIFKDYVIQQAVNPHISVGRKDMLGLPDFIGENFLFYSNNTYTNPALAGQPIPGEVKCQATLAAPGQGVLYAGGLPTIAVESLTVISLKPNVPQGQLRRLGYPKTEGNDLLLTRVATATIPAGPGIEWKDILIQVPDFGQIGEGAICQLITADRHVYRTVQNPSLPDAFTHFRKEYWNGIESLDIDLPYPFSGSWNLAQGTGLGYFEDTPRNPLLLPENNTQQWTKSTAHDTFKTWVMYKPPKVGDLKHVWIPLVQFEWHWKAEAHFLNGTWVVEDPDPNNPNIPPPDVGMGGYARIDQHPVWSKRTIFGFPFVGVTP